MTPAAPAERVVEPIISPDGFVKVNVFPSIVYVFPSTAEIGIVDAPRTRFWEPRDITSPIVAGRVNPAPPAESVVEPIARAEGLFKAKVCPSTVYVFPRADEIGIVDLPITRFCGPREIVSPTALAENVTPAPPADSAVEPRASAEGLVNVNDFPFTVKV